MRWDPTEFRKRFAAYKQGKQPYQAGRPITDDEYFDTMEKVAIENNAEWNRLRREEGLREMSVDEEVMRVLNDHTYDYRGYYNKYPQNSANAKTHWTDEFKTYLHPTFSDQSRYAPNNPNYVGKTQFNPYEINGGRWFGEIFIPSYDQLTLPHYQNGKSPKQSILQKIANFFNPASEISVANTPMRKIRHRNYKTDRAQQNNTKTKNISQVYENTMYSYYPNGYTKTDVSYQPNNRIIVNGYSTSTNVLDTIFKRARQHNDNPKLAEGALKGHKTPRKVSKYEAIGLPYHETNGGAQSYVSEEGAKKIASKLNISANEAVRAFYNANVLTAFKNVPEVTLYNNYHFNSLKDKSIEPGVDAYRYFSEGDYNRRDATHSVKVQKKGEQIFQEPEFLKYWNNEGRYWFDGTYKNSGDELRIIKKK